MKMVIKGNKVQLFVDRNQVSEQEIAMIAYHSKVVIGDVIIFTSYRNRKVVA